MIKKIPNNPQNPLDKLLYETFTTHFTKGYLEIGPQKYVLPENYLKYKAQLDNYQTQPNEIVLATHPKTGTTWVQELLWLLKNNLDFDQAAKLCPMERVPYFDESIVNPTRNSIERVEALPAPRLVKTHLPWELLPESMRSESVKLVYVYRNAKDVCSSYYHFLSRLGFTGTLDDFAKLFIAGRISYGPYFKHIESFYKNRRENILFISYEDMKKDLDGTIVQVAKFVGTEVTKEQIKQLNEFLQFDNMKNLRKGNSAQYEFYRSGTVGSFKQDFTEEMIAELDKWIERELLETKLDLPNLY